MRSMSTFSIRKHEKRARCRCENSFWFGFMFLSGLFVYVILVQALALYIKLREVRQGAIQYQCPCASNNKYRNKFMC